MASPALAVSQKCDKPAHWYSTDQPVPEPGDFVWVKVKSKNRYSLEGSLISEERLVRQLSKVYLHREVYQFISGYFYLTSGPGVSCNEFKHASSVVDRYFHCTADRKCVWGYGVGFKLPTGIPDPPG